MLLMSFYVVTILVITVMIIVQDHTWDDTKGTRGGGYDVVMWEIMEPKNTCIYELNDHPNEQLIKREGWTY